MNDLPNFIKKNLDQDYHQQFIGIGNSLTYDPHLRRNLTFIAALAGFIDHTNPEDDKFLIQDYDKVSTTLQTIGREIVMDALGADSLTEESADSGCLLQHAVKKALLDKGFERQKVDAITSLYPDVTIEEYLNTLKTGVHVKGYALSCHNQLKALSMSPSLPGSKKKHVTQNTKYVVSLAQANQELLSDDFTDRRRGMFQKVIKSCQSEKVDRTNHRLNLTRDHVVSNMKYHLEHTTSGKESLCSYSMRENFPVRAVPENALSTLLKTVASKPPPKTGTSVSLPKTESMTPTAYNCFYCDADQVASPEEVEQCHFNFNPESLGNVNVQRCLPKDLVAGRSLFYYIKGGEG